MEVVKSNVVSIERPDAPDELTTEQAEEWQSVVGRMPADWFPGETHGLLVQYCRHRAAARHIAQLIDAAEEAESLDVEGLDRLYKMQEREGRALSSLATRMRITQQATYDKSRKKPTQVKKPWD